MKEVFKAICVLAVLYAGYQSINDHSESDVKRCEVDNARKLHTTAVYIDGKCLYKGYSQY